MYTMNCKHKNKKMLYDRLPATWKPADIWRCQDCGAILGMSKIKVKMLSNEPTIKEKTNDALCEVNDE